MTREMDEQFPRKNVDPLFLFYIFEYIKITRTLLSKLKAIDHISEIICLSPLITVVYTVLGPMVRHYAFGYGFHMFPNRL